MTRSLIIIGEGRIGLSLAADLSDHPDLETMVVGRSESRPTFLEGYAAVTYESAGQVSASSAAGLIGRLPAGAREPVLIFCVEDDGLPEVCGEWSSYSELTPAALLHTSGVHSAAVFDPWRVGGVPGAAWHPMVAVAAPASGAFRGVWFGMDGDEAAAEMGDRLAVLLGGRAHRVDPKARAHYHAAGVFASNYLVACLRMAVEELRLASDDAELEALLPLAGSAIRNLAEHGLRDGATGPVVRGDAQTVASHLEVLDRRRADVYRALGLELLDLTGDRLDPKLRSRLEACLRGQDPVNRRRSYD